jgi:hypothetical protein
MPVLTRQIGADACQTYWMPGIGPTGTGVGGGAAGGAGGAGTTSGGALGTAEGMGTGAT